MFRKLAASKKAKKLASNTLMLSILSFSGYFLALVTLPYQSRILGPELFGAVSFAMAFGLYFQLLIDFGFTLSATEQVAKYRHDIYKVSKIVSAVTWSKLFLVMLSFLVLIILCLSIIPFNQDPFLYLLFALSYILIALVPDYLYRGIENMRIITIRTVLVRIVSVLLIFIFLREPDDYYVVPILLTLGNAAALAYSLWDIHKRKVRFKRISFKEFKDTLRQSSLFFYSRVATNIYSATNTFMLGLVYGPASYVIGYFSSADKLTNAAKYSFSPLVDSIYPHMVRNKDFRLIKKVLLLFTPLIAGISIVVWIYAYDICGIIFGVDFKAGGEYLRWLIPTALIAFPSMVLGYPTLSPMGLAKYANLSTIAGAILQVSQIAILFIVSELSVVTVCAATILTEVFVLIIRVVVILKNRRSLKALIH